MHSSSTFNATSESREKAKDYFGYGSERKKLRKDCSFIINPMLLLNYRMIQKELIAFPRG